MAKTKKSYVCQNCGAVFPRWSGKCDSCGEWNTIEEEIIQSAHKNETGGKGGRKIEFTALDAELSDNLRLHSEIAELDRVCGGGIVIGSVLLIGGDPGIGKSTLLLQTVAKLSSKAACVYITGEESANQIRIRAKRLGLEKSNIAIAAETSVRDIVASLDATNPEVVVIDSIQTMYSDTVESAPGTVGQVRACANELIKLAKRKGFILFLVGHVTKEGNIAGPRVLEHMVDTVLYFEGDRGHHFRILRSVKNRFGATDEIGVFEMQDKGLIEIPNPSAMFLAERKGNISGSCVFAGVEGTRPVLVEIQALCANCMGMSPRRSVVGWDNNRLLMLLAVIETRLGISLGNKDVFLNIAGGLRITEPAADMAVIVAILSSYYNVPTPAESVFFGEVGLSGEVRNIPQSELRLKEAMKMGFKSAVVPKSLHNKKRDKNSFAELEIQEIGNLKTILEMFKG